MISKTAALKRCFLMGFAAVGSGAARHMSSKTIVSGPESLMAQKDHGTCPQPVQQKLRYGCDRREADHICCFNRHYAEHSGYAFSPKVTWLEQISGPPDAFIAKTNYYDSVTGKRLFMAPVERSLADFVLESQAHGWPSFRDNEVDWDNVRVLANGETVSVDGTHLGHNLPDSKGNRYCINLVSIAGSPKTGNADAKDKVDRIDINQ